MEARRAGKTDHKKAKLGGGNLGGAEYEPIEMVDPNLQGQENEEMQQHKK